MSYLKRKVLLLDIEADGLDPTVVWVVVCKSLSAGKTYVFNDPHSESERKKLQELIDEHEHIVAHYGIEYDFRVLSNLLKIEVPFDKIIDTVVVSKLLKPDREGGHSLEAWGKRLGVLKTEFNDFSKWSQELSDYCVQDVNVLEAVFKHLFKIIDRNPGVFDEAIRTEQHSQYVAGLMHRNGFRFDIEGAQKIYQEVSDQLEPLLKKISETFPPKIKITQLKTKVKTFIIEGDECLLRLPIVVGNIIRDTIKRIEKDLSNKPCLTTTKTEMFETRNEENIGKQTLEGTRQNRKNGIYLTWSTLENTVVQRSMECLLESIKNCSIIRKDIAQCVQTQKDLLSIIVTEQDVFVDCSALGAILDSDNTKLLEKLRNATSPRLKEEVIPFNPGSPKQVVERMWELGWKPKAKTKSHLEAEKNRGKEKLEKFKVYGWKINEENLATLPEDAPEGARLLVKYTLLSARLRTLTEWIKAYNPETGRIHGEFDPLGTATHRMSHSKPNMSNIATKKTIKYNTPELRELAVHYGGLMRSLWICDDDAWLCGTDMEGAHLRIFAHLINDPDFTKALIEGKKENGTDPHSKNKGILGAICVDRDRAKTFIFSYLNGASAPKVSEIFGCSLKAAKEALDTFVRAYPGLALLKSNAIPRDAERGYFIGVDGRYVLCDSEHLMMGMLLQNAEATLMKRANRMWMEELDKLKIRYKQVNFVHDEWVTEVYGDKDTAILVGKIQSDCIRKVGEMYGLRCPLAGESKVGKNWLQVH